MTTRNTFLNKIFSENDKAKNLYADYDFSKMSKNEIYFLEKLSIISKYKDFIKNIIQKKKIPSRDKLNYIQVYKANLSYQEYIQYNVMIEQNEDSIVNCFYLVGILNFCAAIYFVIKKEPNESFFREMTISFFGSFLIGSMYYNYKKKSYRKKLDELFHALEIRQFKDHNLLNSRNNKNFVSSESFDENIDDSF